MHLRLIHVLVPFLVSISAFELVCKDSQPIVIESAVVFTKTS